MANLGDGKDLGHEWHSVEARDAFYHVLDTFSGANADFPALLYLVRQLDDQAAAGDDAAGELLRVVGRMSRLIEAAHKIYG
jgi:hypothetical protein